MVPPVKMQFTKISDFFLFIFAKNFCLAKMLSYREEKETSGLGKLLRKILPGLPPSSQIFPIF